MTSAQITFPGYGHRVRTALPALRKLAALLAATAVLTGLAIPASADPQGYIEDDFGVGYFYQSFEGGPNVVLLAGGTAAEFCETAEAEEVDPFNAEPGSADVRVFLRDDGSVDLKVNDKGQPIHLYDMGAYSDAPVWINAVCAGEVVPDHFAAGTADLKVRISLSADGPPEHVFNSVNGKATAPDGTEYKVRGWADVPFEGGVPVGTPPDWVGLEITEIGR